MKDDDTHNNYSGVKKKKQTTKGWDLCVQWKGGYTSWVALKDMKNGLLVQTAKYAIKKGVDKEPAFSLWMPYTMLKAKHFIAKVKGKYWQQMHKYGIKIPQSVKEAYAIDTCWTDVITEEMAKIKCAVRIHDGHTNELYGYQQITGYIIFDVKLVVSRDSIRIILILAALMILILKGLIFKMLL